MTDLENYFKSLVSKNALKALIEQYEKRETLILGDTLGAIMLP